MSSLTAAGSSMEEEEEEFDTRLSLEIGETSRPPPQSTTTVRLFGELISPQDNNGRRDHHREPRPAPAAACCRKKRAAESGVAIASSGCRHGNKKHELARRVGLSARQVEVWFQNRRARTKLKQTEVDRELLRRWCDRLTDENARLRRDLTELRVAAASAGSAPGRFPVASAAVLPRQEDGHRCRRRGATDDQDII